MWLKWLSTKRAQALIWHFCSWQTVAFEVFWHSLIRPPFPSTLARWLKSQTNKRQQPLHPGLALPNLPARQSDCISAGLLLAAAAAAPKFARFWKLQWAIHPHRRIFEKLDTHSISFKLSSKLIVMPPSVGYLELSRMRTSELMTSYFAWIPRPRHGPPPRRSNRTSK